MVVRTRLRAILSPLLLYAVSGAFSAYFIWTAIHGERGLRPRTNTSSRSPPCAATSTGSRPSGASGSIASTLMRRETVDRDLAGEEIRLKLDYVDPRDL